MKQKSASKEHSFDGYDFVASKKDSTVMWLFISSFVLGEEFALTRKCCYWLEDCLPGRTGSPAIWFSTTMMKRRRGKYLQVSVLLYLFDHLFISDWSCLAEFKTMFN